MNRTIQRILYGGLFALWVFAAAHAVHYDVTHDGLKPSTIIVLIITGGLALIRFVRAWVGDFTSK
ncbi:hypothetical protein [Occallatibacter savannae]|uniref:hypothetical protein n=1 Tax=Occallatibacter savannae TaxID=1002691 RepID=UPI0013A55BD4|nr:hypothetical protein [Occallatibacter savannae]